MFSYEEYYKLYNCRAEAEYRSHVEQLKEQLAGMNQPKEKGFREKVFWYLKKQGQFLQVLVRLEEKWTSDYAHAASLHELKDDQEQLYGDIRPEAYASSYANPLYASSLFGKDLGPVLAMVAAYFRQGIADVRTHRRFMLNARLSFYFTLVGAMTKGQVRARTIHGLLQQQLKDTLAWSVGLSFHQRFDPSDEGLLEILEQENLNEIYYLYTLGPCVSDEVLALHQFVQTLEETEVQRIAEAFVRGFIDGFARDNKDIRKKSTVAILYPMGMERIVREAIRLFREEAGVEPFIQGIEAPAVNDQYLYDHRFDELLCMDAEYTEQKILLIHAMIENNSSLTGGFGGRAYMETFGEEPFVPQANNGTWEATEEQRQLFGKVNEAYASLLQEMGGTGDSSYTMIAFPTPAIGEQFAEIFRAMIEINTLDQKRYSRVQQSLIQALDRGTEVFIKGGEGNETALTVALQPLENPRRQTNFYNCLADVNIPLGEVFTSPQLAGTNGILHVESIYLRGLCFRNLKLRFEDGYVTDYSCDNFENPEEGRRFIYENLLMPHDTLPMGEFAIGTNTTAYCMAKQFDILDKLPILVIEKMGPHFAIGDTCYVGDEDRAVFNPDRKEICSRENERTRLRKEDPAAAYTRKHTDITLPYESIGRITILGNGTSTDVIREGRFVLLGTDILNEPMIRMEQSLQKQQAEQPIDPPESGTDDLI